VDGGEGFGEDPCPGGCSDAEGEPAGRGLESPAPEEENCLARPEEGRSRFEPTRGRLGWFAGEDGFGGGRGLEVALHRDGIQCDDDRATSALGTAGSDTQLGGCLSWVVDHDERGIDSGGECIRAKRERGVKREVGAGVLTKEDQERAASPAGIVDEAQAVGKTGAKVQERCAETEQPRLGVRGAGGGELVGNEDRAGSMESQRIDECKLARAGVGKHRSNAKLRQCSCNDVCSAHALRLAEHVSSTQLRLTSSR